MMAAKSNSRIAVARKNATWASLAGGVNGITAASTRKTADGAMATSDMSAGRILARAPRPRPRVVRKPLIQSDQTA